MSPVALPTSPIPALLDTLRTAPTGVEAKAAAEGLAGKVKEEGLQVLEDEHIISSLLAFCQNKKSGYERESGAVGIGALARVCGPAIAPALVPTLPVLLEMYMDKGDVVRSAADKSTKQILKLLPPEYTPHILSLLTSLLPTSKWRTKSSILLLLPTLLPASRAQLSASLASVLPSIEACMHDTKQEVAAAAVQCAKGLCGVIENADVKPHIPDLVACMARPDEVPRVIRKLASTTFVAEVTAPVLAVMVPLLARALNDRSMETQRLTVLVISNLVKLVRDPAVAATYLSVLVPGVEKIATGAAFPDVRAFGQEALGTLIKAGASATFTPPPPRDRTKEAGEAYAVLVAHLPQTLVPLQSECERSLRFSAALCAELVHDRRFGPADWDRCLAVPMHYWLGSPAASKAYAESVREAFAALDAAQNAPAEAADESEGELLCDTLFSLAYGALLLLNHTTLRLYRGRRYGICAGNGSGKSTLMRAIAQGKVENFPPPSELRAVMVEHTLQGEDASMSILDFVAGDPRLREKGVSKERVAEMLGEVGFDEERRAESVGSLSGGWKMKLELARAMLYEADLLLLDEPTNHLDVASVQWLESYLTSLSRVTCLIVSHDSGFLDNVTTDIIHYEQKKLVYYRGNLSKFVEKHPEARSYYTLAATSIKFAFPPPGSLMGVRSNTRAILKPSPIAYSSSGLRISLLNPSFPPSNDARPSDDEASTLEREVECTLCTLSSVQTERQPLEDDPASPKLVTRRYSCLSCSKTFSTSGHLARHLRIHTGVKGHVCPFPGCFKACTRVDNIVQHFRCHLPKQDRGKGNAYTRRAMEELTLHSEVSETTKATIPSGTPAKLVSITMLGSSARESTSEDDRDYRRATYSTPTPESSNGSFTPARARIMTMRATPPAAPYWSVSTSSGSQSGSPVTPSSVSPCCGFQTPHFSSVGQSLALGKPASGYEESFVRSEGNGQVVR